MLVKRGGSMNYEDVGRRRQPARSKTAVRGGVVLGGVIVPPYGSLPQRMLSAESRERERVVKAKARAVFAERHADCDCHYRKGTKIFRKAAA